MVKYDFDKWVQFQVHNGRSVSFWDDVGCGNSTLKHQFRDLYLLDSQPQSLVADKFEFRGGINVLSFLYLDFVSLDKDDNRLWSLDSKGYFSVKFFTVCYFGEKLHE